MTYTPYAHIDFQPSRVTGMTVFGAQLYHPCLKKVVPLFKYYAEDETSESAVEGLQHFNEALKIFTEGKCDKFNPEGWMSDEAGSLIKAMDTVYGQSIHARMVTCKAHFFFSVERMRNKLGAQGIDS